MSRCWCVYYRAADGGPALGHIRGKHGFKNCMHATDKDTEMREQVRGSFVRVSEGLARTEISPNGVMAYDVAGNAVSGFETIAEACGGSLLIDPPVSVSCEHTDVPAQLIAERDLLLRMVDELLEQDIPCVDVRWYRKHVEGIRRGKPVHDFR
jgi:hypothetical protein